MTARWGEPEADPFVRGAAFHLPVLIFGNVAVLLQPARGYDRDETAAYHDPDLVPPHAYVAAYLWLKHEFGAHAVIHNGKHGSLEWLPGKATALDGASYPAALWGELPHLYPFIVNDPGEGTQAKRRTGAVIIDHLVPPLTRAETYGPLKDLEALLDEYYAASGMDRRRLKELRKRILDFTRDARLDRDVGLPDDESAALLKIDTFLCDLKEAQIRDGLHVFGESPTGRLERDLLAALARVPRGERAADQSLIRALADDLKLGFDPLTAELGEAWTGPEVAAPHPSPSPQRGEGGDARWVMSSNGWRSWPRTMIDGAPAPGPGVGGGDGGARSGDAAQAAGIGAGRTASPARRARRQVHCAGAIGGAVAGAARCAADGAQFLLGRQSGHPDADGVGTGAEIGGEVAAAAFSGPWHAAAQPGAERVGHVLHADGWRRHRAGAGVHRREAGVGPGVAADYPATRSCRWRSWGGRGWM